MSCAHDTYYVGCDLFFCRRCKNLVDPVHDRVEPPAKRPFKMPWWETAEDPRTWDAGRSKKELPPPPPPRIPGPMLTKKQYEATQQNMDLAGFV